MPQPRKYKTNAERQAAYRARKRRLEAAEAAAVVRAAGSRTSDLVARVMAADAAAQ